MSSSTSTAEDDTSATLDGSSPPSDLLPFGQPLAEASSSGVVSAEPTPVQETSLVYRVDPELESYLPQHTADELQVMEDNFQNGRVKPIVDVWEVPGQGPTILDGHATDRYCREHGIEPEVRRFPLANMEAAKAHIRAKQRGRRNLTPLATSYYRGQEYQSLKHQGVPGDSTASGNGCQKCTTGEELAARDHVSPRTIGNDARFTRQVDQLVAATRTEVRQHILGPQCPLLRKDFDALAAAPADTQKVAVDALLAGQPREEVMLLLAQPQESRAPSKSGHGTKSQAAGSPTSPSAQANHAPEPIPEPPAEPVAPPTAQDGPTEAPVPESDPASPAPVVSKDEKTTGTDDDKIEGTGPENPEQSAQAELHDMEKDLQGALGVLKRAESEVQRLVVQCGDQVRPTLRSRLDAIITTAQKMKETLATLLPE